MGASTNLTLVEWNEGDLCFDSFRFDTKALRGQRKLAQYDTVYSTQFLVSRQYLKRTVRKYGKIRWESENFHINTYTHGHTYM